MKSIKGRDSLKKNGNFGTHMKNISTAPTKYTHLLSLLVQTKPLTQLG